MVVNPKTVYATIGHRLARLLLSPTAYGYPGGKACLEFAYRIPMPIGIAKSDGFKFEKVFTEDIDFFDGPDVVAGYSDENSDYQIKPLIAFVYDDLNLNEDFLNCNLYDAYQAKVIFEESLKPEIRNTACSVLDHAVTLLTMKANLHTLIHDEHIPIILSVHEQIIHEMPMVTTTMVARGFKHDDHLINDHRVHLFHRDLKLNF